jgi:hypothetical protein
MMDNLMRGLAGRKLEDGSIEYRERSPLVVPSQIALPPPQTAKTKPPPNWPKDPDEAELKAARELAKQKAISPEEARRPLMPSEMVMKKPRGNGTGTIEKSDPSADVMVMPSQLGYKGGLFSGVLGDEKGESEKFVKEPQRIELTQPPTGYQTPSPNQAYGVGKREMTEQCDMSSGKCEKTWK